MHPGVSQALAAGTRFVRVVWTDNANVIRAKAVHAGALADFATHGVGITAAQQALPVMADTVVADSGLGPVGEIRLVPDWDTLTPLPTPRATRGSWATWSSTGSRGTCVPGAS